MIRDTIDLYLSCIDRKKIHLVLQLWYVTFLTVGGNVAVTASGYEPWGPATFLIVWLAIFMVMEGIGALVALVFSIWVAERWANQRVGTLGDVLLPTGVWVPDVADEDGLEAFWGNLAGDEGGQDDDR